MAVFQFTIRLTSDAEPGTGLGGEVVNQIIPRDHRGQPMIPASHVKGLMRAALQDIAGPLGWDQELETRVFGCRDESRPGIEAAIRLTDATAKGNPATNLVTRTSVGEAGVAKDASLRTTESISLGTEFSGEVHSSVKDGCVEDIAWRLALLAVSAVGSSRNRGCGACVTVLHGEQRSPGKLLQELDAALQNPDWKQERAAVAPQQSADHGPTHLSDEPVVLRLVFHARTPICCPEIPDKTNVISTGFSIPASTVQGLILSRLNVENPALATALFDSALLQAWPLHPCWARSSAEENPPGELPTAIRVSLTHRAAKFSEPEGYEAKHFFDEALDQEPYDWTQVADGAPLKASDGVLLRWPSGEVRLWKATAMPHAITSHGVHSDPETDGGRNLFTVDAMAPMVWQGLVVMPANAAHELIESLRQSPVVGIGKSRSVRGIGELRASVVDGIPDEWQTFTGHTVLVVQSPLLLPDQPPALSTSEGELESLATDWTKRHGLPKPNKRTWANVGVRFGWNRHRAGFQPACRVILPGSVIAFSERLDAERLAAALKTGGIGQDGRDARQRSFGAVCVHPGKAVGLFPLAPKIQAAESNPARRGAIGLALQIRGDTQRLPSPSQIRALEQHLLKSGKEVALQYLKRQTERTSRIWFTWEPIYKKVSSLLTDYDEPSASRALEVLANLAIVDQKEQRE
jgi:hypothetical protein